MKHIKFTACLLALVLPLTLASCSWWFTTPIEDDRLPDEVDTPDSTPDDYTEVTGIPDINSIDKLGEGFERFSTPDGSCVVTYNKKTAFVFDYMLGEVTPLVDFEAMIDVADPIERAREYFTDVTLDVECKMSNDIEIMITFNVRSSTHDASYSLYSFYTVDGNYYPRGMLRGYYATADTVYPGSDEPIVITALSDWEKFGYEEYEENWLYKLSKAFLECDAALLEDLTYSQAGTLAPWENVTISDYKIMRENPTDIYFDAVTLIVNISESGIERYPAGEYKVVIADGPGFYFTITPTDTKPDMHNPSRYELFIRDWVARFGGWYPVKSQTLEISEYAHHILDLYLNMSCEGMNNVENMDFAEFCETFFGYEDAFNYISRDNVENHGGHGGTTALCEVEPEFTESSSELVYTVTFFADELKTTVARVHRVTLAVSDDSPFRVTNVECILDNGFGVVTWGL